MQSSLRLIKSDQQPLTKSFDFFEPLFEGCQIATKKYIPQTSLTFERVTSETNEVFLQEHQSIILLWTPGQFIKFSILYSDTALFNIYGTPETPLSTEAIVMNGHRMKEFCNLIGGLYRTLFEENGVFLGMSLPLLTAGKSENTFLRLHSKNDGQAYWKASHNQFNIFFSVEYQLNFGKNNSKFSTNIMSSIQKEKGKSEEDSGEIEFL